jgi:ATP-dependent Lhr-like helicase
MLLDRYGIVSREAVACEGLPGGFGGIAPVLRAMEESGKIRRGHFVDGLQGAQFAHAAAVDRLRAARSNNEERPLMTLSAIDPANPYGALLPWPSADDGDAADKAHETKEATRARRVSGARVVLAQGEPVFFVERGGKKLRLLSRVDETLFEGAMTELRRLAAGRRHRQLRIEQVDGVPALHSPHIKLLERGGFRVEPGALVLSAD